jgi:hypothetical protein
MTWKDNLINARDADGSLTDTALALDAISDTGCDCDSGHDWPHTCLAGKCEAAIREQWERAEKAEARMKELEERLQFDPGGSDKIDELEQANQFMRHSRDCAEADLARIRPVYEAAIPALSRWKESVSCTGNRAYCGYDHDGPRGCRMRELCAAVEKAEEG